jgi:sugar phosphate isomerase/epimerase
MKLGVFTKHFVRDSFEDVLDAVKGHGFAAVQLNLESIVGVPAPDALDDATCDRIRDGLASRDLELAALSGTFFNIIHSDTSERARGLHRLRVLAAACARMGAPRITFATGTRSSESMWAGHPANNTREAWADMLACMTPCVQIAAEFGVPLCFEPEVSNVVDTAVKARALLDHFDSPYLKVVLDGANLFHAGELLRMREILDEAFELLGPDIALAHAKDLLVDGEAGNVAAGRGKLDYDHYLTKLQLRGWQGALILHSLDEGQVPESVAFVRGKLATIVAGRVQKSSRL